MGSAVAIHAALRPSGVAVIDEDGALTWSDLNDRVRRLANAFLEVAAPGDRVAFVLRNGRENVECYAACGLAGMAAVPVNTWSARDEVQHIVDTQRPALIVILACQGLYCGGCELRRLQRSFRFVDAPVACLRPRSSSGRQAGRRLACQFRISDCLEISACDSARTLPR